MPFDTEGLKDEIALCLSGGGYRAVLYHLGSIKRLNEFGLLSKLDRISSVSGGSIVNGVLATRWTQLEFNHAGVATNLDKLVVTPLRQFCSETLDVWAILKGGVNPFKTAGDYVTDAYRDKLGLGIKLTDLPTKPRFIFNSTNLKTGINFRFSQPYCGDFRIGLAKDTGIDVATAVCCSSAFPPVLSPIEFKLDPKLFERQNGSDLYDDEDMRSTFSLTDGGVYDNLGLETAWKRCRTVLVSDAGKPFEIDDSVARFWPSQLSRVIDVGLNQALALRKRVLMLELRPEHKRYGAYWGIATPIDRYQLDNSFDISPAMVEALSKIRTRLDAFSETEQGELINWGYAACDSSIRAHYLPTANCGTLPC